VGLGTVTAVGRFVAMALMAVVGITCWTAALAARPAAARTVLVPRLSVIPSTVRPGDTVALSAYDLASLTNYQVQVCGNAGFGGSSECNLASSTSAATSEVGHFVVFMKVLLPPVPCPCVVKAIPLTGAEGSTEGDVLTPITILGAQTAPVVPPSTTGTQSGLVVDQSDLVGTASWAEFFGGSAHRTLVLELRDAGVNLIPSTPFVLRSGPAGDPTQIVESPVVPPLRPGEVISYRVPVTFPPLAHGNYVVVGTLGNTGQIVSFTATTPLMPWGIVILVALVVLTVLGLIIWRIVRRRGDRTGGETPVASPTGDPAAAATDQPGPIDGAIGAPTMAAVSSSDPESPGAP
jgi:hypothetical protein